MGYSIYYRYIRGIRGPFFLISEINGQAFDYDGYIFVVSSLVIYIMMAFLIDNFYSLMYLTNLLLGSARVNRV